MSETPDPLKPEEPDPDAEGGEGAADDAAGNGSQPAGSTPQEAEIDRDWRIYEEHRKELLKAQLDSVKTFESWLMGLSGGALTLSISVVKELIGADKTQASCLLLMGWLLLGTAIVCVLLIKLASYLAHKTCIEKLDGVFTRHSGTVWKRYDKEYNTVCWIKAIYWLRGFALGFFLLGIVSLAFFVYYNVGGKSPVPSTQTGATITVTGTPVTIITASTSPSSVSPSTTATAPASLPAAATANAPATKKADATATQNATPSHP